VVEMNNDEAGKLKLILSVWSVETPRSPSMAAKSLAEPLEACQPQEGLKT
jgi:hypothetical protein